MIDLDSLNKPIEIKINKQVIKVNQPTYSLVLKTRKYLNDLQGKSDEELANEQNDLLLEFLNDNNNNKKFTEKDILKMSLIVINELCALLIKTITGVEEDPN